jgi:hypothetical protein
MAKSIESKIKSQYAKFARKNHWLLYKNGADYYLHTASLLMIKDIKATEENKKLLFRNITKRLYLGIGCELLLKALYLKRGYHLNLPNPGSGIRTKVNLRNSLKDYQLLKANQTSFADLISYIYNLIMVDIEKIKKGLNICKVFRNKEAHSIFMWHSKDRKSYDTIEEAIQLIYLHGFNETLDIKITYLESDNGIFKIN